MRRASTPGNKYTPIRRCAGCGTRRPRTELLRIVRRPEGEIVFDPTGRLDGRGAHVCPDPACLERARKRGSIARSLHLEQGQYIPDPIWEALSAAAERRA